jgi:putative transposase
MTAINYRIKIEPEKFYHIWNRGNNRENLFYTSNNYEYFLRLYDQYLDPVAETYAFCLLPNHFHFLIRTKPFANLAVSPAGETVKKPSKSNPVSLAFQRFFTTYSQAINIQQRRTGSLFQKPFKRLEVTSTRQLANLVNYIHTNPQKHKIADDFRHYPWSSYERILKDRPSKLNKEEVLQWFSNKENYINYHNQTIDLDELKHEI